MAFRFLSKEQMVGLLQGLANQGWLENQKPNNAGGIGNTIDALLGLPENNLPISDSAQWEMKTHRRGSESLITLLHVEPLPRATVPKRLLPLYGWPDQKRPNEMSFRGTLNTSRPSERGFQMAFKKGDDRVLLSFDSKNVDLNKHSSWLRNVEARTGKGQLAPQPYWEIQQLVLKVSTKMLNAFFVEVQTKREGGKEFFRILEVRTLQGFSTEKFLAALEQGNVFIDFDARTRHNHGTKIRIHESFLPQLYTYVDSVVSRSPE